jgi:hypothetical protein
MSTIVSSPSQVLQNIGRFGSELKKSSELQGRLAFARAWYSCQDNQGAWQFAPSKFCGYKDMTAAEYFNDDPRDGRRTEKQLQTWFIEVERKDPLYDELMESLTVFLDKFGKPPCTAARINVTKEFYNANDASEEGQNGRVIADLLIAVGRSLSTDERARVRAAL